MSNSGSKKQPDLAELFARHGTQSAIYVEDYIREKGAHRVACTVCGCSFLVAAKPTKREVATWRCGECSPRPVTPMEARG